MITVHKSTTPASDAARALNALLHTYHTKDTLLLVSGGSALALVSELDPTLFSPHITVSVLDERFTFDATSSNFAQLAALPIWSTLMGTGITTIDTRPHPHESLEDTAHRLNIAFKHWHITHHDGVVIALMGVGSDGHTAGILPMPHDPTLFHSLFLEDHRCIRGYQVSPTTNQHTKRMTTTLSYLTRHVTDAIVYAVGTDKCPALTRALSDEPIEACPARIVAALPHVELFTDCTLAANTDAPEVRGV